MKRALVTIITVMFPLVALAESSNSPAASVADLAKLLAKWADICEDRWEMSVDADRVCLYSKEAVLGSAPGYNFGPGEENYRLQFRFKVVSRIDSKTARQRREYLKRLRKEGNRIDHQEMLGRFRYHPKGEKEWDLVLQIRRAEAGVADIPNLKFRSAYLAEEYSMSFFQPNEKSEKALQCKKDIDKIYNLLERIVPQSN